MLNNQKGPLQHIPVKIILLGMEFSGKKTQAKLLNDLYQLKIYSTEELIDKNLEILERIEIPVEYHPNFKNMKKNEIEKMISERNSEEQKIEPYKELLLKLKVELNESNLYKRDEAIVDYLINVIRIDFPEQTLNNLIEEIKLRNKKFKEINEEIRKIKEEKLNPKTTKASPKSEHQLQQEKHKLIIEGNKGFILVDFPKTFQQAQILERKLTNFVSELEKTDPEITKTKSKITLLCDQSNKIPRKKTLFESGLSLCVYLEGNLEECLRRSNNRKLDPLTGVIYHSEDFPIPTEEKKIIDRLINGEDFQLKEEDIREKIRDFNLECNKILEYYSNFGLERINFKFLNKLKIFQKNNNHGKTFKDQINTIHEEINNLFLHLVKINSHKEKELLFQHSSGFYSNKENIQNFGTISNDKHLVNQNNVIPSVDSSLLQDSQNDVILEVTQSENKSASLVGGTNTITKMNKEKMSNLEGENLNNTEIKTNISNQVQNLDEDDFNRYNKKLIEAKKKIIISSVEELFIKWKISSENYIGYMLSSFKKLKKQKENLINNFTKMQNIFIDFLKRPSKKLEEINKYIEKFNKFINEYPQLIGDKAVKEQFKEDLSDINDTVWDYIEERKKEAIEEKRKIVESGFIDKEMERFYNYIEKIFFYEAEKFDNSLQIIRNFYTIMDSKPPLDLSSFKALDILMEGLNEIGNKKLEKENIINVLKLERLFRNCIRMIMIYDDIVKFQEKNLKVNNNNVSLDVSVKKSFQHKMRKTYQESTFMEDKKEIFIYEEELKNTLEAEKKKFKFRAIFLKNWGKKVLIQMKNLSETVYKTLDFWIIHTIKAENEAMINVLKSFEYCLENEQKISNQIELDSFEIYDVVNVEEFINFEEKVKFLIKIRRKRRKKKKK